MASSKSNGNGSAFKKFIEELVKDFKGSDNFSFYAVVLMSICMYMPNQSVSIASKHLTVALNIPERTTKLYLTKFYYAKTMSNFLGSILMLFIQMISSTEVLKILSVLASLSLCVVRVLSLYVFISSSEPAVYYYYVMISSSFLLGMFVTAFYPLIPDHMSILSITFKLSRLIVWIVQIICDLIISRHPKAMIITHIINYNLITIAGVFMWSYNVYKPSKNKSSAESNTNSCKSGNAYISSICNYDKCKLGGKEQRHLGLWMSNVLGRRQGLTYYGSKCKKEMIEEPTKNDEGDYSLMQHFRNAKSPIFLCIIGWATRAHFMPGVLPYSLLPRSKCHLINLFVLPFALFGSILIHCVKKMYKTHELSKPWNDWFWHASWFLYVPPMFIIYMLYSALHYDDSLSFRLLNNRVVAVILIAIIFHSCLNLMESIGYPGVSGNTKVCDENKKYDHKKNGLLLLSINSLVSQLCTSISYKLSSGYLLARSTHFDTLPSWRPTNHMNKIEALCFWVYQTLDKTYIDIVEEFKGNIRDYV